MCLLGAWQGVVLGVLPLAASWSDGEEEVWQGKTFKEMQEYWDNMHTVGTDRNTTSSQEDKELPETVCQYCGGENTELSC